MKLPLYRQLLIAIIALSLLTSCGNSSEKKEESTTDTVSATPLTVTIPEEFRKAWTALEIEGNQYHEICNPTTLKFQNNPETQNWQLLRSDLLSAERPKTILFTKTEGKELTVFTLNDESTDTLYFVIMLDPSVSGLATITTYSSSSEYKNGKKSSRNFHAPGAYKGIILPSLQECDFGDAPEVFIDSSYIVNQTFCNWPSENEEGAKLQFKLRCNSDGTLSGTANQDVTVGLAEFSRGSWEMENHGVAFRIYTSGKFPANGDSLVEYPTTISIGSFYELQGYKQCK